MGSNSVGCALQTTEQHEVFAIAVGGQLLQLPLDAQANAVLATAPRPILANAQQAALTLNPTLQRALDFALENIVTPTLGLQRPPTAVLLGLWTAALTDNESAMAFLASLPPATNSFARCLLSLPQAASDATSGSKAISMVVGQQNRMVHSYLVQPCTCPTLVGWYLDTAVGLSVAPMFDPANPSNAATPAHYLLLDLQMPSDGSADGSADTAACNPPSSPASEFLAILVKLDDALKLWTSRPQPPPPSWPQPVPLKLAIPLEDDYPLLGFSFDALTGRDRSRAVLLQTLVTLGDSSLELWLASRSKKTGRSPAFVVQRLIDFHHAKVNLSIEVVVEKELLVWEAGAGRGNAEAGRTGPTATDAIATNTSTTTASTSSPALPAHVLLLWPKAHSPRLFASSHMVYSGGLKNFGNYLRTQRGWDEVESFLTGLLRVLPTQEPPSADEVVPVIQSLDLPVLHFRRLLAVLTSTRRPLAVAQLCSIVRQYGWAAVEAEVVGLLGVSPLTTACSFAFQLLYANQCTNKQALVKVVGAMVLTDGRSASGLAGLLQAPFSTVCQTFAVLLAQPESTQSAAERLADHCGKHMSALSIRLLDKYLEHMGQTHGVSSLVTRGVFRVRRTLMEARLEVLLPAAATLNGSLAITADSGSRLVYFCAKQARFFPSVLKELQCRLMRQPAAVMQTGVSTAILRVARAENWSLAEVDVLLSAQLHWLDTVLRQAECLKPHRQWCQPMARACAHLPPPIRDFLASERKAMVFAVPSDWGEARAKQLLATLLEAPEQMVARGYSVSGRLASARETEAALEREDGEEEKMSGWLLTSGGDAGSGGGGKGEREREKGCGGQTQAQAREDEDGVAGGGGNSQPPRPRLGIKLAKTTALYDYYRETKAQYDELMDWIKSSQHTDRVEDVVYA